MFDEHPSVIYASDLPTEKPAMSNLLMTYNNFGICQQVQIHAQ
jgi:hypothetical protein